MKYKATKIRQTTTGYEQTLDFYQAIKCNGCPLRAECHDQVGNRTIQVSHNLNRLKAQADKRLKSKKGMEKRKQRCFDTEPVFANIKHNHNFKRFMLRGIEKVKHRNRPTGTRPQPEKENSLKKTVNLSKTRQ